MGVGMTGHQKPFEGKSNVWLTPMEIIHALYPIDLDPCANEMRPFDIGVKKNITRVEDGLTSKWEGFVFCNPPYGPHTGEWLEKMSNHGNGIALIFARTETRTFFKWVWNKARSVFFIEGRLFFMHPSGKVAKSNAGAPSCLVAYGDLAHERIKRSRLSGKLIEW